MSTEERKLVEYKLPEGTYTGGLRRATAPVPHDCPRCGSLADDPNPAHLVDEVWIDCPRCPPTADEEDERTADQKLKADVRDILREEASRGTVGGSSSGGGRRREKPRVRMEVRWEQEQTPLHNGHSGDRVSIKRLETASERVELQLSLDCKEMLREASHERRDEAGRPFPQVQIIREALRHVERLQVANKSERGVQKVRMELRMYPGEVLILDRACEFWELTRGEVVEACLEEMLGE